MTALGLQFMPVQTPEAIATLREDIREHGVQVPVVIDQHGRILDGNNRAAIATELGIDYPTETVHVADDDEAEDRAIALNLKRRTISQAQMRKLIQDQIDRHPDMSDRAIAKRLGCTHPTVATVRRGGKIYHPDQMTREEAEKVTQELQAAVAEWEEHMAAIVYFLASNAVDLMRIMRALQHGELTLSQGFGRGDEERGFWAIAARITFGKLRTMVLDEGFQAETQAQAEGPCFLPLLEDNVVDLLGALSDPSGGRHGPPAG